jgi:hypothetical protein
MKITISLIIVSLVLSAAAPAWAISDRDDFPPSTIARGQGTRVVATHIGDPDIRQRCQVTMTIFGPGSVALGGPDTKILNPGEFANTDFIWVQTGTRENNRTPVRAEVWVTAASSRELTACFNRLQFSQETFDVETERTLLVNPLVIRGFNPQPDPPGIPVVGQ